MEKIVKKLRVIRLNQQDSCFNVALDEALLGLVKEKITPPTIVFTEWSPTVSIGFSQDPNKDVDLEALKKYNATLVRRITGGQAVYLDEGYIVFSIIAPANYFPRDLTELRKDICGIMVQTLREINVPAEFYPPDNVIIKQNGNIMTIGNSGQRITKDAVAVHGSIRYDLLNFENMLNILMINSNRLNQFSEQIKPHLASVKMFSNIPKEELKEALLNTLLKQFNANSFKGELTSRTDHTRITQLILSRYRREEWIFNATSKPVSRGVCYFYLNGKCIIPEIEFMLPYNQPSSLSEATIGVPNV